MSPTRMAPRHDPTIRPRPPKIAAPPTITDEMTISSTPKPDNGSASLFCATFMSPAVTAHSEDRT